MTKKIYHMVGCIIPHPVKRCVAWLIDRPARIRLWLFNEVYHGRIACPSMLRNMLFGRMTTLENQIVQRAAGNPYRNKPPYSTYNSNYPVTIGIFKEMMHWHVPIIRACSEMRLSYKLIDINAPDWIEQIKGSGCDAFFYHPSTQPSIWKNIFDERLHYIHSITSAPIFPKFEEMFMYESKRRMAYWMEVHGIPHARTFVSYSKSEALKYVKEAPLPIVAKTNMGAQATGVHIFHDRNKAIDYVNAIFGKGIILVQCDSRDVDWGCAIFQEFIETPYEWRVIKIGDAFFAHQKRKNGDYCSGSGRVGWVKPPEKLLDFVRKMATDNSIDTADFDVFENEGQYCVNEIQAFWGWRAHYQMLVNGVPGYYQFNEDNGNWEFIEGIYCRNGGYNLRIIMALKKMGINVEFDFSKYKEAVDEGDRQSSVKEFQENK